MAAKKDFSKLMSELEEIVSWFEREDVDLDKALPKFEEGMKLAGELKQYLEVTENKVEKIKQKFAQEEAQAKSDENKTAPKTEGKISDSDTSLF